MNIGQKIKDSRKRLSLTQQQVADKMGVNRSVIANYERSDRLPTLVRLKALCKALEMSVDEMLND